MHTIAVLALDGVIGFDLTTPLEVFGRTRLPDGRTPYRLRVCARRPEVAAAALDLCLHPIRRDHGAAVAADAARLSVMALEREGGQAQFVVHEQPPTPRGSVLEPVLRWMEDNAGRELTLEDIAAHAGMSTRTLNRRFREQTGTTPLQWLHRVRIRQAQHLLETTTHPVDRIAAQVGFGSPTAFRDRFKRVAGTSPHAYRRAFR